MTTEMLDASIAGPLTLAELEVGDVLMIPDKFLPGPLSDVPDVWVPVQVQRLIGSDGGGVLYIECAIPMPLEGYGTLFLSNRDHLNTAWDGGRYIGRPMLADREALQLAREQLAAREKVQLARLNDIESFSTAILELQDKLP